MKSFLLGAIFFVCLWIQDGHADDYTITPLSNSPGLYYEQIGEVSLSNNNWEFVTSINYTGYLMFYEYLHKQAEKLYGFCQKANVPSCFDKFESLKTKLDTIDEEDEKMITFLGYSKPRRSKRFWAALGGFLAGFFGFGGGGGGQPDMSKYDNAISGLRQGQMELNNKLNSYVTAFLVDSEKKKYQIEWLEKTQTEIKDKLSSVESEFKKDSEDKQNQINNLNDMLGETRDKLERHAEIQRKILEDVDKIEKKLVSVDNDIKDLYEKVANNSKKIDALALEVQIHSMVFDFNFLMDRFLREQSKLFNSIEKANKEKQGEFDPSILTPLNLIEMLQEIIPNLKENEKFPFYPNIENARRLYNLITPRVKLSRNYNLLFILKLPLVNFKRYSLYKMSSVPVHVTEGLYSFILPQEPFLLIDKENEQEYTLLSLDDYKDSCMPVDNVTYICKQTQYVQQVQGSKDCEVKLFTSTVLPKTCNSRLMRLNDAMFIQLQERNSWLYVAPMSVKDITATCGNRRNIISLQGTGFMHFDGSCNIRIDNNPLISIFEYTKSVVSNFSSGVNLLEYVILPKTENLKFGNKNQKITVLPFDFKSLSEVSIGIDTIEADTANLYWLFAIPVVVTFAAIIFLAYRMNRNFKEYRKYFSRKSKRNDEEDAAVTERLRMKVKTNDKNEKISKITMQEHPSEDDPNAEYLTVKFKVEKTPLNNVTRKLMNTENNAGSSKVPPKTFDSLLNEKFTKNVNVLDKTPKRIPEIPPVDDVKLVKANVKTNDNKDGDYMAMGRPLPKLPEPIQENDDEVYGNHEVLTKILNPKSPFVSKNNEDNDDEVYGNQEVIKETSNPKSSFISQNKEDDDEVYGNAEVIKKVEAEDFEDDDDDEAYGNVIVGKKGDQYLNELRKLKLAKLRGLKPNKN